MTDARMVISDETVNLFGLSRREKEIAISVLMGLTNNEIAREKYIALATVKKHISNLLMKTNSRNRIELFKRLHFRI